MTECPQVKPYHRDESTEIPANVDDDDEIEIEDLHDPDWTPDDSQLVKKKRGRPTGSKNTKKKTVDIDSMMTTGTMMTTAYLSTKERTDNELALRLRREGKITTTGEPFELSDRKEIDMLMSQGVFAFEKFDPVKLLSWVLLKFL